MAGHDIGFVTNSSMLAHYAMLEKIRDVAVLHGWTVLRYDTVPANRELILRGSGFTGTEEIFVGLRTYQDAAADYYNLCAAGFTGYVAGNTFDTQPGARLSGIPAHNQRIDYWLTVNPQRIALAMKVGTPVYESAYVGKMLPYARPSQYPYPVVCAGMLNGAAATRFSDASHSMGYKGNTAAMGVRFNSGAWLQMHAWPWNNAALAGATSQIRDTANNYPLMPVVLNDNAANVYGELDGIYQVTGFNNTVESTFTVGGKTYVVIQDVARTGFNDYYAMRLD
jgi:hypothetical protein